VNRSESKQYQGIDRLEVRTGRVVRQEDSASGQARVKTRRARKKQRLGKIGARRNVGSPDKTRRTGTERQKTQINTPGTNGDIRRHMEVGGDNHQDR
jgi:hypothetical protein